MKLAFLERFVKKPIVISTFISLGLLVLTFTVAYQRYQMFEENRARELSNAANVAKEKLQAALRYSFSATQTLGFIITKYGAKEDFAEIAHRIITDTRYVDALELVEGGTITHVYPLEGNESVIGYNILDDTSRNKEALKAIEKRALYFAGPFELKQGGMAIVGRLPIFRENRFWGFSAVLIKLTTLIKAAEIDSLHQSQYIFQLSKINPDTHREEFFLPHPELFEHSKAVSVTVPAGEWKIYVIPASSDTLKSPLIPWVILALLLSFTGGIFAWFITNEPYRLEKSVEEKTYSLQSEKKLSDAIINGLPGIFYMYDTQGRFVRWNRNFELASGYSAEEVARMHPTEFFPAEEQALLNEKIESVFQVGFNDVEANFLTKSGHTIPYYFNGVRAEFGGETYLIGMGIDITERKKIETERIESEEKYRYLFNHNPALIIIWELETLKILEANDTSLQVYGYTRQELLSMDVAQLRPEEDRPLIHAFARQMLTEEDPVKRGIWKHVKKSGEIMYMDIASHRIDYNNRKAILSLAKDITIQYQAEEELKKSHEDIRRLNTYLQNVREEERSSIAREIHDELGQQLTGLKMDITWLSKKLQDADPSLHGKTDDMISLVDHTIKTVRRISSDLRPGILDDLGLIAALEWQSSEFEKRSHILCSFHTNLHEVHADKKIVTGIFRVYQEALTNIMRHAEAHHVQSRLQQSGHWLELKIKDDGKGFEKQEADGKKTLGLIGMQERARMMGGELLLDSAPGKGTTVTLKIPFFTTSITDAT